MPTPETYTIVSRSIVPGRGWVIENEELIGFTMDEACMEASRQARILDASREPNDWTVTLRGEYGDVVQLFHGRLI